MTGDVYKDIILGPCLNVENESVDKIIAALRKISTDLLQNAEDLMLSRERGEVLIRIKNHIDESEARLLAQKIESECRVNKIPYRREDRGIDDSPGGDNPVPETPRVSPPQPPRALKDKEGNEPEKAAAVILVSGAGAKDYSRDPDWWRADDNREGAAAVIR